MNKFGKLLFVLAGVTLILSGCTSSSSSNSATRKNLTNQEKAVAAYIENYKSQMGKENSEVAIKNLTKQTEFTIKKKDNNHFEINRFDKTPSGEISSVVSIGKKQTVSKNFSGDDPTDTKTYMNWTLNKGYSKYEKGIQKLINLSEENKDDTDMMSDEELTVATYLEDKMSGSINQRISKLRQNTYFIIEPFDEGHSINCGDSDTEERILVYDDGIYVSDRDNDDKAIDAKYQIQDINKKYKSYESKISSLVKMENQAFQKAQPEIIED